MAELSPAALTALEAAYAQDHRLDQPDLAAFLRAVADEVVPPGQDHWLAEWTIRRKLLKIAKELEGSND